MNYRYIWLIDYSLDFNFFLDIIWHPKQYFYLHEQTFYF